MKHKKISLVLGSLALALGAFVAINNNTIKEQALEVNAADYYAGVTDSMSGTTLLNKLNEIVNSGTISVSYDWDRYEAADQDPNNSNNVILVYSRISMLKSKHDTGTAAYVWNREHTFPQSKLGNNTSKNDNHIVFASEKTVNAARGNLPMGVVTGGTVVNDYNGNATTCRKTSSLFDPNNVARGIVARSTMYAAAMYGFDPEENFESIETMLRWHLEYQPTTADMTRNNTVYSNQHNRNPFVDHPEYACRIWGDTNSTTQSICGSQGGGDDPVSTDTYTLVTSNSQLSNGDKVVLTTIQTTNPITGVTGWNSSNDATVSTTSSEWCKYVVGNKSNSGFTLKDTTADSYIASPTGNHFKYSSTGGTVSAESDGKFVCNSRYLCKNNSYYRCYTSYDDYTPFYIYKVTESAAAPTLSSITLNTSNVTTSFNVGDTFSYSGLMVTAHYDDSSSQVITTGYTVSSPDMSTAGNKTVTVSYGGKTASYTITVNAVTPTSITATVNDNRVFYVGETITKSDITVKTNTNVDVTSSITFNNYQFKYEDSYAGGTSKTQSFAISYSNMNTNLNVTVQRKARSNQTTASYSVTYTDLPTSYQTSTSERTAASGVKFIAYNLANYSSKMQFKASGGYFQTTQEMNLSTVTINNRETNALTVYGSNTYGSFSTTITGTNDVYNLSGYKYVKIMKNGSGAAYCSSISIVVSGAESASNVSNYIMYEDTNNQCLTKLNTAIGYINNLSSSELNTFRTSNDYVIATARERLEAWARSQDKTIDYSGGASQVVLKSSRVIANAINANESSIYAVLIIASMLTASIVLGYFLIRRKQK